MEKGNITECIKTFEDARMATGRPNAPDFTNIPEDLRSYFDSQYRMAVITEALNEGWQPDWANNSEYKYFPWFSMSRRGLVFDGTCCWCTNAVAGGRSRLCFKTKALAKYAGEKFIDIWRNIQLK